MSDLGNKEVFAKNLKHYMELNEKNRNDLCKDLGFKYSTVTDWINGNIYPRIDKIEMLANYFKIEKSDLIENKSKQSIISDDNDKFYMFPVYNQFNPKENPDWENNSIQGRIPIDLEMFNISNPQECFFIKVNYDSMNYVIRNGQYALIQKQSSFKEGDIILIVGSMFNKVILRKCVQIQDNIVLLRTEHDGAELSMIDTSVTPLEVIGKCIGKIEINK